MVAAISMVKDEADIVETTVRRMADQVDLVIVADNSSTDGTRQLLTSIDGVEVIDDPEVGYFQSRKMTELAQRAAAAGATWVIPFDADEVWAARDGRLADVLQSLPDWVLVCEAALYDHVATGIDPAADPVERMRYRRAQPAELPKVACRPLDGLTIAQGNHGATYAHTDHPPTVSQLLTVRHFPYRSPEQFVSKARNGAAAYAATDLPEDTGKHWRDYGAILMARGEEACADIFRQWFWVADPTTDSRLVLDPCPTS